MGIIVSSQSVSQSVRQFVMKIRCVLDDDDDETGIYIHHKHVGYKKI